MGVQNKLIRKLLCRKKSGKSQPLKEENENPEPSSEDTLDIWDQQRDQSFELNDDDNIFEIQLQNDDSTTHQEEVIIDAQDMKSEQALLLTPSDSDAETDIIMELKDMKVIYPVSDSDAEPEPEPEPDPDTIDIKDIILFHQPNSDSDSDADVTDSKADVVVKFEPEINPDDTPRSTSLRMLIRQSLREERSAVRIQAAFRAFLARRMLRGLKGLVRLQALMRGHCVRKRGATTFRSTLALVRVQARVRARRVRIAFECQMDQWRMLQKQQRGGLLLDRVSKETEGGWCDSIGSFEEMQSKLMKRKEAAVKRERSRAYALARQWQARSRHHGQAHASAAAVQHCDFKPDRSNWAWDWMEKWSRVRSWDRQRFLDLDLKDGIKIIRKRNNEEDSVVSKTRKIKKLAATSNSNHKKVTFPSRSITIPPHGKKPNSPVDEKSSDRSRSHSNPKERLTCDKDGRKRLSLPGHGLDHHRAQQMTKQVVPRTTVNKKIIPAAPKPVKVNKGHELKPTRLGLYAVESIH